MSRLSQQRIYSALIIPVVIRLIEVMFQFIITGLPHPAKDRGPNQRFLIWDAQWYGKIVDHWYPHSYVISGTDKHPLITSGSELAFSPVYPVIAKTMKTVTGMPTNAALIIVAITASCIFSVGVYLLSEQLGGNTRTNYIACALIGALPMSVVFQMGYAESTYAALSVFAIILAYRHMWLWAGSIALVAGLTRPTGFVLAAGLFAIAYVTRSWSWRSATSVVLAGCGSLINWIIVAVWTHDPHAFFTIQEKGWGTKVDFGSSAWDFLHEAFTNNWSVGDTATLIALIIIAHLALIIVLMEKKYLPFALMLTATMAYTLLMSNFWHSKPRLMLASALMVIPLAHMSEKLPRRIQYTFIPASIIASMSFGAFMIVEWQYAM